MVPFVGPPFSFGPQFWPQNVRHLRFWDQFLEPFFKVLELFGWPLGNHLKFFKAIVGGLGPLEP